MPNKYYESKKQWNSKNYKQLNLSINPELYESFQAACEQQGHSMRKIIVEFLNSYSAVPATPEKSKSNELDTRNGRRKALKSVVVQLTSIRDAEEQYLENIPENLKNSSRFFSAEQTTELLGEALDLLGEAFS